MMHKKQSRPQTWLPLIFLTVLNGSQVQADSFAPNPLQANGQPPMMQQEPMDSRFAPVIENLRQRFPHFSTERVLLVDTTAQHMFLIERGRPIADWIISTAEKGVGSLKGSDQTPLGVHRIAEKIGAGAPFGMIFKSRQPTGEIVQILSAPNAESKADYVTSRILWLDGLEPGINQGGDVDSKERFIYIHGTGEEGKLGTPASHGCIRMRNQDVIELFDQVNENTLVVITRQHQDR